MLEVTCDALVVGSIHHDLHGLALSDLDFFKEYIVVVVDTRQSGDRHGLRDAAELEHVGVLEHHHVVEAVGNVSHGIRDHFIEALERSFFVS